MVSAHTHMRDHVAEAAGMKETSVPATELEDDWLNVFERYAEDASSERLQGLWGKVLAGEIRRPGRFSTRTIRFLSEFSQADAVTFENFAKSAFDDHAPKKVVIKDKGSNITNLINLEASGLVQGASGLGLRKFIIFDNNGRAFLQEEKLFIVLSGEPGKRLSYEALILTPLGQEVLCLVGTRNAKEAAKVVANAIRTSQVFEAHLGVLPHSDTSGGIHVIEVLWQKEISESQTVEGTAS